VTIDTAAGPLRRLCAMWLVYGSLTVLVFLVYLAVTALAGTAL
jgi:hypothetical protein